MYHFAQLYKYRYRGCRFLHSIALSGEFKYNGLLANEMYSDRIRLFEKIALQKSDDAAGNAGAGRPGLEALLGAAATEIVRFLVHHQGPTDRPANTHQAQVVIRAIDTRHSVLPDLDIAEIADVTQRIARCSVIHLKRNRSSFTVMEWREL